MKRHSGLVDVEKVLSVLKRFQRDTVDYVFGRMYLDNDKTRRFLVADEVGLGKTLVARGVIARVIEHLDKEGLPRIDIVYICSNADIARQNIARLNVTGKDDFEFTSRITMLPDVLRDLNANRVNLVSFTPSTSFDLESGTGRAEERALMCRLLGGAFDLPRTGLMNVLQVKKETGDFRWLVRKYEGCDLSKEISDSFPRAVKRASDILPQLRELCRAFRRTRKNIPPDERNACRMIVGKLRALLAATCREVLKPALIILDEFQRFRYLLEGTSEAGLLAREMFEYSKGETQARVLLLSATPYKMYTIDGVDDEDHYKDFQHTLQFLAEGCEDAPDFELLLREYRSELLRLNHPRGRFQEAKERLEKALRKVMVRTERLAVTPDRSGMLNFSTELPVRLRASDLSAYVATQRLATELRCGDVLELWKSTPYMLNFMEGYKLKQLLRERVEKNGGGAAIVRAIEGLPDLLARADIERYRAIDPGNARLRALVEDILDKGLWKLLWVPPALPYYDLGGPFSDEAAQRFTKRLVFSTWRLVPRVISAVLSYEAERRMVTSFFPRAVNPQGERRRRPPLLRFSKTDGRLTGMPVLGLVYPCFTLVRECDPLQFFIERGQRPSLQLLMHEMEHRIQRMLGRLRVRNVEDGREDETWYWLTPLLLDYEHNPRAFSSWFDRDDLAQRWSRGLTDEVSAYWEDHVNEARRRVDEYRAGKQVLGRRPADLAEVLAQSGIAGFGTVVLRALCRVAGSRRAATNVLVRDASAAPAHSFLSLFNAQDAMPMIRGLTKRGNAKGQPYWRLVIKYALEGGLQAVMDEYVHLLHDSPEYVDHAPERAVAAVAEAVQTAMALRPAQPGIDWVSVTPRSRKVRIEGGRLRNRFAVRFGDDEADLAREGVRAEQIRKAFNSPFWPFVLATTSVGQEGLDFHCYCHAVVHWNLPANPVDLEQREGRVHRYKGLAVRRNLAVRYGSGRLLAGGADPWATMFQLAVRDQPPGRGDIWPYWVCTCEKGVMIERHVPMLPLSRESDRLSWLQRSLAAYRMVFGQARQEDLLQYLMASGAADNVADLTMDLSPPGQR